MLYDKLMNPKGALTVLMLSMLFTGSLSVEAARKKTVQKIKVACVGNSITYGTGIEDREHFSYPVQLQKMLGDKYLVGNFGKPGATLLNHGHRPYMKQEEYRQAMAFKGDIAVIHLAGGYPRDGSTVLCRGLLLRQDAARQPEGASGLDMQCHRRCTYRGMGR